MSLQAILKRIPDYAQDIKKNLNELFSNEVSGLTASQVYGVALTVCYSIRHEQLLNNFRNEAKIHLEDMHFEATKTAAVVMTLNTTYHTFTQMLSDDEIRNLPMDLHTAMMEHSKVIDEIDYSIYLLGAAIFRRCRYCINLHTNDLVKKGVSKIAIRNIGRIVAVLAATAEVLYIESVRSYDFNPRGESI